jgi:ubiquinone/menaquinone biosynthesis C-methylase UbiE
VSQPGGDQARDTLLREMERTYAGYAASGYADRWSDQGPGMRRLVGDRDAWLVKAIRPTLSKTVVDLGCGAGALASLLDQAGARPARLVGCDILEGRLAQARERAPWAEFVVGSADAVPLPDGSSSAVVAMTLLSSLTDDWFRERIAAEVGRLLEPGGRFVVYDIRYPSPRNHHVRPVTSGELRRLFPGWHQETRSISLLPPLARSSIGNHDGRYRILHALPFLRSHLAAVLTKP